MNRTNDIDLMITSYRSFVVASKDEKHANIHKTVQGQRPANSFDHSVFFTQYMHHFTGALNNIYNVHLA